MSAKAKSRHQEFPYSYVLKHPAVMQRFLFIKMKVQNLTLTCNHIFLVFLCGNSFTFPVLGEEKMSRSPGMSSSWSFTESYPLFRRQSSAKDVLQGMRDASKTFMYQSTLPGIVKSPVHADKFPHLREELYPTIDVLT